jgi:putative transposase
MTYPAIEQQFAQAQTLIETIADPPELDTDLFGKETTYFVTGATYNKRPLLMSTEVKTYLFTLLHEAFQKHKWELQHWVILDNHYHVLGKSLHDQALSEIFDSVHGRLTTYIRYHANYEAPIWDNYWSYCPKSFEDYMNRVNYLLMNPVTHGYVLDLRDYPFSSFHDALASEGRDQLVQQFMTFTGYKHLILHEAQRDDF